MFWEQITVDQFAAARETCGGVRVIPVGCLEKHGNQLPLGTDILTARTASALAAEKSEVMIFPYLPFGIVSEVKHKLGTVALSSQLQYHMLEELCEEIARNGFHKILFVNGHGGNTNFLRYFSQSRHEHPCDYTVFTYELSYMTDEQYESFLKLNGPVKESGHADIYETSVVMAGAGAYGGSAPAGRSFAWPHGCIRESRRLRRNQLVCFLPLPACGRSLRGDGTKG